MILESVFHETSWQIVGQVLGNYKFIWVKKEKESGYKFVVCMCVCVRERERERERERTMISF